jgi:hypothetical protein
MLWNTFTYFITVLIFLSKIKIHFINYKYETKFSDYGIFYYNFAFLSHCHKNLWTSICLSACSFFYFFIGTTTSFLHERLTDLLYYSCPYLACPCWHTLALDFFFYIAGWLAQRQTLRLEGSGISVGVYSPREITFTRLLVSPSPLLTLGGFQVPKMRCELVLPSLMPS